MKKNIIFPLIIIFIMLGVLVVILKPFSISTGCATQAQYNDCNWINDKWVSTTGSQPIGTISVYGWQTSSCTGTSYAICMDTPSDSVKCSKSGQILLKTCGTSSTCSGEPYYKCEGYASEYSRDRYTKYWASPCTTKSTGYCPAETTCTIGNIERSINDLCVPLNTFSCVDSDNGAEIFNTRNSMTVKCNGITTTYTDLCSSKSGVIGVTDYKCSNVNQETCAVTSSWIQCSSGDTCSQGACGAPCTPTTCQSLGKNCGEISNGCGGTLNCGTCLEGNTCMNNVCTPDVQAKTCVELGKYCDVWSDGLSGTVDCGSCDTGFNCLDGICEIATACTSNTQCNDGNDCTTDICTTSGCINEQIIGGSCQAGTSCLGYQKQQEDITCKFSLEKLFTKTGFKAFWSKSPGVIMGIAVGIILLFILLIIIIKKRNNPLGL